VIVAARCAAGDYLVCDLMLAAWDVADFNKVGVAPFALYPALIR
jgi:hypothetical protein